MSTVVAARAPRERMLAGLPVAERRVDLAGTSTAVLEAGAGPPLVLLHGGIECGGAVWAPVVARLAERHRVVIPDLPGLGESEPVERLDSTIFAAWFTALLRATCDERPVVVAHSLGGSLAARYRDRARRAPRAARDLRGARRRALPDAARAAGDGDPVRAAPDRAQRGAVRPLGVLRLRPRPRSGP